MVRYMRWPGWALRCLSLLAVAALPGAARGSSSLPDREQTPAASPAPACARGEARRRGGVLPAGRRPAPPLRPLQRQHGRRSPADRGPQALRGRACPRGSRLVQRCRDAAAAGAEARPGVGRHPPAVEPDLHRCPGPPRPGRRARQEGPGRRTRRHRHPRPARGVLQQEERPARAPRPCCPCSRMCWPTPSSTRTRRGAWWPRTSWASSTRSGSRTRSRTRPRPSPR